MAGNHYSGSLTREQFLFYEIRTVSSLILQGESCDEIYHVISTEYMFQFPTEKMIKSITNTCFKRIDAMNAPELVYHLANASLDVAKQIKERHAKRVFICTTYGLFTEGMDKFDAYYEKGWIDKVITTNLNYRDPELLTRPYYVEANMSKYLASIMDIINHDLSVEKVRSSNEKIMELMEKVEKR